MEKHTEHYNPSFDPTNTADHSAALAGGLNVPYEDVLQEENRRKAWMLFQTGTQHGRLESGSEKHAQRVGDIEDYFKARYGDAMTEEDMRKKLGMSVLEVSVPKEQHDQLRLNQNDDELRSQCENDTLPIDTGNSTPQQPKEDVVEPLVTDEQSKTISTKTSEYAELDKNIIPFTVGRVEQDGHYNFNGTYSEDKVFQMDDRGVFGVFDGVGQGGMGGYASELALKIFTNYFQNIKTPKTIDGALEQLRTVCRTAHNKIIEQIHGGATTAVVGMIIALQDKNYLVYANAGDSMLVRYRNGVHEAMTTEQILDKKSRANIITNSLGDLKPSIGTEFGFIEVLRGDKFLFCSDGITGDWGPDNTKGIDNELLDNEEFTLAFEQPSAQKSAEKFLELSKKQDDKAALVIFLDDAAISTALLDRDNEDLEPVEATIETGPEVIIDGIIIDDSFEEPQNYRRIMELTNAEQEFVGHQIKDLLNDAYHTGSTISYEVFSRLLIKNKVHPDSAVVVIEELIRMKIIQPMNNDEYSVINMHSVREGVVANQSSSIWGGPLTQGERDRIYGIALRRMVDDALARRRV